MPFFPKSHRFSLRRKSGVIRLSRDSYSNVNGSWWEQSSAVREMDRMCCDCGVAIQHSGFHIHHIQPLSKGGKTVKSNLILLCARCHSKRHNHL